MGEHNSEGPSAWLREKIKEAREKFPPGSWAWVKVKVLHYGECGGVAVLMSQRGTTQESTASYAIVGSAVDALKSDGDIARTIYPPYQPAPSWKPKVGERVKIGDHGATGTVLAVAGDEVWVERDNLTTSRRLTYQASDLRPL